MVDVVESNRSAAAEEKREAETKVAEVDFEEEEGGDSLYAAQASSFRETWIRAYSRYFGNFEDTTKIPNMRFTYKKPDLYQSSSPTTTLQIFSIKVARIRGNLQWPLHVFGKVAVRDVVDHNRNMIFDCPRESCQILNQEVPYLKLTGPTRAAVLVDPVTFEVDLKVKGITQAEDECLSFLAVRHINFTSLQSKLIKNDYASKLSTLEFEIGHIVHSVEATIFVANEKVKALEQMLIKGRQMHDDCSIVVKKLRAMLHSAEEQLHAHKKQTVFLTQLAAKTLPKGLHCLPLRLANEYFSLDPDRQQFPNQHKLTNPKLYHYALFSDNILATAVVVNSTVLNAKATIEVQNIGEFTWLNDSYSPVLKQLGSQSMIDYYFGTNRANPDSNLKYRNPKYLSILNHLRFYLPEIYPKLDKMVFLDDDIVVKKDLTGLWSINMKGKVNGLGYNPHVNSSDIERAAVIHYNGNMKPWLEIGLPKFRSYWSKYLDYDQPFLRECNINP
ncbi:putative galacturonosyltransferase 4 isoform X6 [Panicum miliaceum]|uniref:Hexosyltransferase n=1 Tax=Panicum miliaceum TaxID=4540 RepID=A0A3L6Q2P4_PANMI|nr:putative galacturonosyltransferase 4 isoform X6 [Panicum miliaceum]